MLNRKTNRKVKTKVSMEKEFDFPKFKEQMSKEMSRFKNKKTMLNISVDNDYEKSYKQYISEGFTYSNQMIITRMFSDSKTLPKELRNEYPLHSLITKIANQLMMNELEIVYFSIYLDTFGWINDHFDIIEHFLITGLSVKKYLNFNTKFIENFLSVEYPNILEKFNKWLKMQKDYHLLITITPKDVNTRFNLLKRPYNTYCKNNFIDYNESVDRILQMSMPYGEGSKNQKLVYQPSVKNDDMMAKPKKTRKAKEKMCKAIKDKSGLRMKKEKPSFSFNVVKHEDNIELEQEKMKHLLNLKDDSTTSNNIITGNCNNPLIIKVDKTKEYGGNNNGNTNNNNNVNVINVNNNNCQYLQPIENNNEIEKGDLNQNNYNGYIKGFSHQNSTNLLHQQNSNSNFNNMAYTNPGYSNYNLDFIKQSSDFNFNGEQMFFGRNTSGIDQVFFRRSSTQNFEAQEELNDPIFKPIDCKQHISFGSLAGDFKLDNNMLNMNIPKINKEEEYLKQQIPQYESLKDNFKPNALNSNTVMPNTYSTNLNNNNNNLGTLLTNPPVNNVQKSLNNPNYTNNTISNNNTNLIQNNAPAKKNLLFAFQELKNNKQ